MSQPLDNPAPRTAPLPAVLQSVKHDTRGLLAKRLHALFQRADDALFEMADRAASDVDQNLYFDSMRIVRLQRASIQQKCIDHYSRSWSGVMSREASEVKSGPQPVNTDAPVQLTSEQREIAEATNNISTAVATRHQNAIAQLNERLEVVCGHDLVPELNPLGPQRLNQNFLAALEPLDVHRKVLLTLLQLFGQYVTEELGEVYNRANRILIDASVLPDLPNSETDSSSSAYQSLPLEEARIAERHFAVASTSSETVSRDFAHLQGLLSRARDKGDLDTHRIVTNTQPGSDDPSNRIASTPQLLQALGQIQSKANEQPLDLEQPEPAINFRATLARSTEEYNDATGKELQQRANDAIDLTQLLFDRILDDPNLATPMKSLIARMQIPVVKVAIIDPSLFSSATHPARQLLNELSETGIGWNQASELKRDETYNRIKSIVLRVMDGFNEDLTLFSNLIAELRHFVNKETQKRNQVEARVCETAAGKAKTREAQKTVQTLVNQKSQGLYLPRDTGVFVSDAWSKVLVYLFITQGTDSEPWNEAIETLDDLLWATTSFTNERDIDRREALLPRLLTQLEAGITLANLADAQELLINLRTTIDNLHEADQRLLDQNTDEPSGSTVEIATIEQPAVVLLPESDVPPGEVDTLADSPFIERIIQLREGQWLELRENSGARLRCKLATIVQPGNLYVFVNRKGMKVCERSRNALALALQADELKLIDESEMFERALQSVTVTLQRTQERQAS